MFDDGYHGFVMIDNGVLITQYNRSQGTLRLDDDGVRKANG